MCIYILRINIGNNIGYIQLIIFIISDQISATPNRFDTFCEWWDQSGIMYCQQMINLNHKLIEKWVTSKSERHIWNRLNGTSYIAIFARFGDFCISPLRFRKKQFINFDEVGKWLDVVFQKKDLNSGKYRLVGCFLVFTKKILLTQSQLHTENYLSNMDFMYSTEAITTGVI